MTSHPCNYDGIAMRSALEVKIAMALDEHGVNWGYEVPVELPDGTRPKYLPDFTVWEADDQLDLPKYIEVKPMEMLYDLASTAGIYRKYGEYFDGEISVDWDADTLKGLQSELWKPKMLAEYCMGDVLVLGAANATKRLSILMRRDDIAFSRSHPFVNWAAVEKQRERDERAAWQARINAERQRQWEAERAERERQRQLEEEQAEQRRRDSLARFAKVVLAMQPRTPRFASGCYVCSEHGDDGSIYHLKFVDGMRWVRVCDWCHAGLPARANA